MKEGTTFDKKSVRVLTLDPNKWNLKELARDCVGFANARGGEILFGVEDDGDMPPAEQRIGSHLPERLVKGIHHHTINVAVSAEIRAMSNGGGSLASNSPFGQNVGGHYKQPLFC